MTFKEWTKRTFPKERITPFAIKLLSFLLPILHRTWRITEEGRERTEELIASGGVIMVTWHGRALVPFTVMRNRGCHALVSQSGDGALLAGVLENLGWGLIRGSTGRGAVAALKRAKTILSQPGAFLAFTPDGPRGPAGVAQPGMIFLARKTGKPLIPVGIAATPRKLFKSWDRFMVPLPFARVHFIYGEPLTIPDDEDLPVATLRVQTAISALEARAERTLGSTPLPPSLRPVNADLLQGEEYLHEQAALELVENAAR
ncbi:MAG: lysophospholipid acyltransferase family protein [Armatimonadetes bacterium]|nr:lysophospholipid acyltransferase family protein [Armatimonadota bacterium]